MYQVLLLPFYYNLYERSLFFSHIKCEMKPNFVVLKDHAYGVCDLSQLPVLCQPAHTDTGTSVSYRPTQRSGILLDRSF